MPSTLRQAMSAGASTPTARSRARRASSTGSSTSRPLRTAPMVWRPAPAVRSGSIPTANTRRWWRSRTASMSSVTGGCTRSFRGETRHAAPHTEGPPVRALSVVRSAVGLNEGGNSVAVRDDLAARDLRRVRNRRGEVLVADPLRHEVLGLVGLLEGLEETKRAKDAVAGLDQVVAGETGKLPELRDERLVDLADDLAHAGRVDAFVPTNGGMHLMLLLWGPTGQSARMGALRQPVARLLQTADAFVVLLGSHIGRGREAGKDARLAGVHDRCLRRTGGHSRPPSCGCLWAEPTYNRARLTASPGGRGF